MGDIVVGSGPSGISVAKALLARGRDVTMIDGGRTLEPKNIATRAEMAAKLPADWSAPERSAFQAPQFDTPDGQARRYGSDFAMEPADATLGGSSDWFALRASRATGGLSNFWGAAVLPYRQQDISDWPVSIDDLAPHYASVARFMPVSGQNDDLADLLPGFSMSNARAIDPGPQARVLLARLAKNKTRLGDQGVFAGAARQAVDPGCQGCGMCLHGCPWEYIYASQHSMADLCAHENFTHNAGSVAVRFGEDADGAHVILADGERLNGERVFIGAGVLETARLVLASMPGGDATLTLQDSQHAFLPMLHRWRAPLRPDRQPFNTLPQVFVELDAPEISKNLVHAQIYSWNEHYARDLIANYGFGLGITKPILSALARRLIVAQVFLHSDHSAWVALKLATDGRLSASLMANSETGSVLAAAQKKLARAMHLAGLTALRFASRPGPVGSSFHAGGTVPMHASPTAGQSDQLGRPFGLNRVHLVDASVFPSIPATTITFSVMANAHRIGSEAP